MLLPLRCSIKSRILLVLKRLYIFWINLSSKGKHTELLVTANTECCSRHLILLSWKNILRAKFLKFWGHSGVSYLSIKERRRYFFLIMTRKLGLWTSLIYFLSKRAEFLHFFDQQILQKIFKVFALKCKCLWSEFLASRSLKTFISLFCSNYLFLEVDTNSSHTYGQKLLKMQSSSSNFHLIQE